MADPLPTGFTAYNEILRHDQNPRGKGYPAQDNDQEGGADGGTSFNQLFEDIKEIQQDGYTITVMRTQSIFKRSSETKRRFGEYSLLLRRTMDVKSEAKPQVQLEIQSQSLRNAFAKLARGLTTIRLSHDPIVIVEPFAEIYHCRERVQEYLASTTDDILKAELQLLVEFQQQYMGETMRTITQFQRDGSIEFAWLWAIFPPGEMVVIQNTSASATPIYWCAFVKEFDYPKTGWSITVTHTGFNGSRFGNVETYFEFPFFPNNIVISRLPAYPLRFGKDQSEILSNALRRGKDYENYCLNSSRSKSRPIGTPVSHDGPIWTERDPGDEDRRGCRIIDAPSDVVRGRAVVDFEGFFTSHPIFRESLAPEHDEADSEDSEYDFDLAYRRRRMGFQRSFTDRSLSKFGLSQKTNRLSEDELRTCPPLVPVYSFSSRQWCLAFIDDFSQIVWQPDVFEKLQIKPGMKESLRGLVQGYSGHSVHFDDFVEGKGRGLVLLLYGPSGCGKTMTAESISESLEKPLYHVSGGELGSSIKSIQGALEKAFRRVARWDAILLLDEADAFLAKRDGDNIERNALIAVFLQLLEYQSGIVFLTTNRFGDFDPAFESRIHLRIPFLPLGDEQRQSIWENLAYKNGNCTLLRNQIEALGKLPLNGRRIKNILRLASLFAASRSGKANLSAESQGTLTEGNGLEVNFTFDDIKQILPLAIGSIDGADGPTEEKPEDLSRALSSALDSLLKDSNL